MYKARTSKIFGESQRGKMLLDDVKDVWRASLSSLLSLSGAASLQIRELPLAEFGAQKRFTRYVHIHIRNTNTLGTTRRSTRANLSHRDARLLRTFRVREKQDETRSATAQHGARRANDDETAATRRDVT